MIVYCFHLSKIKRFRSILNILVIFPIPWHAKFSAEQDPSGSPCIPPGIEMKRVDTMIIFNIMAFDLKLTNLEEKSV